MSKEPINSLDRESSEPKPVREYERAENLLAESLETSDPLVKLDDTSAEAV